MVIEPSRTLARSEGRGCPREGRARSPQRAALAVERLRRRGGDTTPYPREGRARCPQRAARAIGRPRRRGRDTAPYPREGRACCPQRAALAVGRPRRRGGDTTPYPRVAAYPRAAIRPRSQRGYQARSPPRASPVGLDARNARSGATGSWTEAVILLSMREMASAGKNAVVNHPSHENPATVDPENQAVALD